MTIRAKRIYDGVDRSDGLRILVDRLWPRGVKKTAAQIDLWCKDAAPSTELRRWFHRYPDRWAEFEKRYRKELSRNSAADSLRKLVAGKKATLLYAARDTEHNHALVLASFLRAGSRGNPEKAAQRAAKRSRPS